MGELKPLYDSIPIDPYAPAQVRMDVKKMALVWLIRTFFELDSSSRVRWYWKVVPVMGGSPYDLHTSDIGDDAYNEMEVLAWVSQ